MSVSPDVGDLEATIAARLKSRNRRSHSPNGTEFRTATQCRYVVITETDDHKVTILKRSNSRHTALQIAKSRRHTYRNVSTVDTALDRVLDR